MSDVPNEEGSKRRGVYSQRLGQLAEDWECEPYPLISGDDFDRIVESLMRLVAMCQFVSADELRERGTIVREEGRHLEIEVDDPNKEFILRYDYHFKYDETLDEVVARLRRRTGERLFAIRYWPRGTRTATGHVPGDPNRYRVQIGKTGKVEFLNIWPDDDDSHHIMIECDEDGVPFDACLNPKEPSF